MGFIVWGSGGSGGCVFVFLSKVDDECLEAVGLNPE